MTRWLTFLAAMLSLCWTTPALADVQLSFHSFNGSLFVGRYPHTFVRLHGELQSTGKAVEENYGFTAKSVSPAILNGPVLHDISIEKPKYLKNTNVHFTVTISDAQYRRIVAEMRKWRDAPGKYYDLDTRNCIHFVGAMAQIVGIKVEYPKNMLRRPKKWLNHIAVLNPSLKAAPVK